VLRAYALGAAGAVLSLLLGAVLWFLIEPQQQPALVWGGVEYTSKQDFTRYLHSRGGEYETWVLRHPGAAPWEPAPTREAAGRSPNEASEAAPTAAEAVEHWVTQLPLVPLGLILASGCALLLTVRRLRPVSRLRRLRVTLRPAPSRSRVRAGGSVAFSAVGRQALASVRAARRLRPSTPRLGKPPSDNTHLEDRPPAKLSRVRTVNVGNVAFGLLSLMAAGLFALYVAVLLSA
jgi:hypothetical protein